MFNIGEDVVLIQSYAHMQAGYESKIIRVRETHATIIYNEGWPDASLGPYKYYNVPIAVLALLDTKTKYKNLSPIEYIEWLGGERN